MKSPRGRRGGVRARAEVFGEVIVLAAAARTMTSPNDPMHRPLSRASGFSRLCGFSSQPVGAAAAAGRLPMSRTAVASTATTLRRSCSRMARPPTPTPPTATPSPTMLAEVAEGHSCRCALRVSPSPWPAGVRRRACCARIRRSARRCRSAPRPKTMITIVDVASGGGGTAGSGSGALRTSKVTNGGRRPAAGQARRLGGWHHAVLDVEDDECRKTRET